MSQKGFSLLEVLVTIAIIGILMSIAIPAYQNYIHKAEVMEGMNLATQAKLAITEQSLSMPLSRMTDNNAAHLPPPELLKGKYVSQVEVKNGGVIQVSFTHLQGSLIFTPLEAAGLITWACQSNQTDLDAYLPAGCTPSSGAPSSS